MWLAGIGKVWAVGICLVEFRCVNEAFHTSYCGQVKSTECSATRVVCPMIRHMCVIRQFFCHRAAALASGDAKGQFLMITLP